MRPKARAPFFLFGFFGVLYLSTLAHTYSYDGVSYALDVEFGAPGQLFHPNHLLYAFLYRQIYHAFQFFGYHGRAIDLMQVVNAWVGAAAVALLGFVLSKRFGNARGMLMAALFGLSQGLWLEAIDPGCYALAALGGVLLLELLLRAKKDLFTGLAHGVLVLIHQMYALALPAFLAAGGRIQYLLGFLLGAGVPYVIAAHFIAGGTPAQGLSWILTPAGSPPAQGILNGFWWNWNFVSNMLDSWQGFVQSFTVSEAWGSLGLGAVLGACSIWSVQEYRRHSARRREIAAVWGWIIALGVFQFFFFHALRYKILLLPPLLYVAAAASESLRDRRWLGASAALLFLIGATNYSQGIAPRRAWGGDRARIQWITEHVTANDFVLIQGRGEKSVQNVSLAYFAPDVPARSIFGYLLDQYYQPVTHMEGLSARVSEARQKHGNFWVEKDLLDPVRQREIEKETHIQSGAISDWFRGFKAGRELAGPDGYCLVELTPARHAR